MDYFCSAFVLLDRWSFVNDHVSCFGWNTDITVILRLRLPLYFCSTYRRRSCSDSLIFPLERVQFLNIGPLVQVRVCFISYSAVQAYSYLCKP